MATIINIQELGNSLSVLFSDGSHVVCYPEGILFAPKDSSFIKFLQILGNQVLIKYRDGTSDTGYNTGRNYFIVDGGTDVPPVTDSLIDNILPGHHFTSPGANTYQNSWAYHVRTAAGRGGDDLNYNFQTFKAPGAGTVSHFDVAGVGMVVKLILDDPAERTQPRLSNDAEGPMRAIWFQHCSAAIDGHHEQGEVIGTSGDGYGQYAPHLHVHGLIGTGNSAGATNRCCFWGFL